MPSAAMQTIPHYSSAHNPATYNTSSFNSIPAPTSHSNSVPPSSNTLGESSSRSQWPREQSTPNMGTSLNPQQPLHEPVTTAFPSAMSVSRSQTLPCQQRLNLLLWRPLLHHLSRTLASTTPISSVLRLSRLPERLLITVLAMVPQRKRYPGLASRRMRAIARERIEAQVVARERAISSRPRIRQWAWVEVQHAVRSCRLLPLNPNSSPAWDLFPAWER